jgi:ribosomal protein S18 acetylase RimI-like enzyme
MVLASATAFRAILSRIDNPAVFATLRIDGRAVAHGCAVLDDGAVGLFEIIVSRESRGRGHGRILVNGLLRWGREQGAQSGWLQVLRDNEVAISLYRTLGFAEAYRYHYRISAQA